LHRASCLRRQGRCLEPLGHPSKPISGPDVAERGIISGRDAGTAVSSTGLVGER
jgi:hypothetical protein